MIHNVLYFGRQQQVMACRDRKSWSQLHCGHIMSRTVPTILNVVWTSKCSWNLPTDHVITSSSKKGNLDLYTWTILQLFTNRKRSHQALLPVFLVLQRESVMLDLNKCKNFTEKLEYLGHVARPVRMGLASHNTHAIHDLNPPLPVMDMKSISGYAMYTHALFPRLHEYLPHLTLTWNVEPKQLDHFSTEETDAILTLRQNLISAPVLSFSYSEAYLALDTDMVDKKLAAYWCRISQRERRSHSGVASKQLPRQNQIMTLNIVNVWLW